MAVRVILGRILERVSRYGINDIVGTAGVKLITPHRSPSSPEYHSQEEGYNGCEYELIPQTHAGEYRVVEWILSHARTVISSALAGKYRICSPILLSLRNPHLVTVW